MVKRFGFKSRKEKLIEKYVSLLKSSLNDEQYLQLAELIIKYHQGFELDSDMINQNGALRTIYHYYLLDKKECVLKLKNASNKDIPALQERIEADDLFLKELDELIINEENARSRKVAREKIEQLLTEEEIEAIKSKLELGEDIDIKR